MSLSGRLAPVALMGALAIGYVFARPRIVAELPYAPILEFPIGALVVGILLWAALSRRRPQPAEPWRRHRQLVRPLPDPALLADAGALERWIEDGHAPEAAAAVAARAASTDERAQQELAARYHQEMSNLASRRKRESYLKAKLRSGAAASEKTDRSWSEQGA